jgi:phosphopantetheinyl transferase
VEYLSKIVNADPIAISVPLPPFYKDHHVEGRPVLAAVEAMERLVAHAGCHFPAGGVFNLADIRFDKFLFLDTPEPPPTFARITMGDDGIQSAVLTSRFKRPGASITRTLTHVSLTIDQGLPPIDPPPLDTMALVTGRPTHVDVDRVYREMVPFGPAYRNIRNLLISPDGALARVGSPAPPAPDPRTELCLGSGYVLDAAFHAACVWCQRYTNTVAFPVAIERRSIVRRTRLDEPYTARIVPIRTDSPPFVFDIFIHDDAGRLCEAVHHIEMRDVSGGRRKPPAEFCQPETGDPLSAFNGRVSGIVLLERAAMAEFAATALTDKEKQRLAPMTPTRGQGYLSARLALKRLSRSLTGNADRRLAQTIETVAPDGLRPQCPLADGSMPYCSVAHDHRFTVAVAGRQPVGVDVEPVSDKAMRAPDLFMTPTEQALVKQASVDDAGAALRVWSAKETVAKATGHDLADVWQRVRVARITPEESRLVMDGCTVLTAWHALVDNHLFTLLTMEAKQ